MVTPKGHGREITMFNPCTGISLSGSALERHSIVSRNVNLHRCQAQDIISNGNSEWAKLLMQVTHIYIYIYITMRQINPELREMNSSLSLWRDIDYLKRLYLSPSSNLSDRSFSRAKSRTILLHHARLCNIKHDTI